MIFMGLCVQAVSMGALGVVVRCPGSGPAVVAPPRALMDTYTYSDTCSGRGLSCIIACGRWFYKSI